MAVIFRNVAIVTLAAACIEVFRKESFGLVLGHKEKKDYVVKAVLPFQTAKREKMAVTLSSSKEKKLNTALLCMSKEGVIGDFHSHPGNVGDYLSDTDIKDLKKSKKDTLSILIMIKKAKKYKHWEHRKDLCMSGTVGDYAIQIKAYEYCLKTDEVKQIRIKTPTLDNLNQKYCKIHRHPYK